MLTPNFKTTGDGEQVNYALLDQVSWPQLITRITQGDEPAFTFFYNHFFDRLFRYVLVMTRGDEARTRELLQKTMVKAVRYLKPFPDERTVWSWLTQLAKTSFIDVLRSEKRAPEFVALESASFLTQSQDDRADENQALEAALEKAVGLLTADERALIQSIYFEERSHKELAASLQSTPKAVESKLARVRRKLRNLLTGILQDENQP